LKRGKFVFRFLLLLVSKPILFTISSICFIRQTITFNQQLPNLTCSNHVEEDWSQSCPQLMGQGPITSKFWHSLCDSLRQKYFGSTFNFNAVVKMPQTTLEQAFRHVGLNSRPEFTGWRSLRMSAMRVIVLHPYTKFKVRRPSFRSEDMADFRSRR